VSGLVLVTAAAGGGPGPASPEDWEHWWHGLSPLKLVPAGDQDRLVAVAGPAPDDVRAAGDGSPSPETGVPALGPCDGRRWAYSAGAFLGGRQALLTGVAALALRRCMGGWELRARGASARSARQ
jgi:hypothetical protein